MLDRGSEETSNFLRDSGDSRDVFFSFPPEEVVVMGLELSICEVGLAGRGSPNILSQSSF